MGMVVAAQPRFDGFESSSGLLVVPVGDAVPGGGNDEVVVCAGCQGDAQEGTVNICLDTCDPGGAQAVGEWQRTLRGRRP